MIEQPFHKIVEDLAARTPTPGGGAAAVLAACLGTALLMMVIRFTRGKKATAARDKELADVEGLLERHLGRLMPMAERDCNSYNLVSRSYGMPKETPAELDLRGRAIQEAMVGAMVVPEESLCMVRDVFHAVANVVDLIGKNIISDLATGSALLRAAAEGAYLNVRINANYLENREQADRTIQRTTIVRQEIRTSSDALADRVEQILE